MASSGSITTTSTWVSDKGYSRNYTVRWAQTAHGNPSTIYWEIDAIGSSGWIAERTLTVVIAGVTVLSKTDRVERYASTAFASGYVNVTAGSTFNISIQAAIYGTAVNTTGSQNFVLDDHNYNQTGALRSAATCTAAATYYYKCSCGAQSSNYFSSGTALGHDNTATGALRSDATCTAAATYWYKCSRCGTQASTYFSSGNALGHNNTATGALRSQATCTAAATYWYKCARCGTQASTYFSSGNALGHTSPADYTYGTANNITNGTRYKNCTVCGTRLATQYGIWANAGTGISGTSGTNWYNSGATATISATPATGYLWSKWSDSNTANPRSITANTAYQLTATGTPITYTITYNGNGASGGSTANSTHTYNAAKTLTTNGYTKPGYKFIGWSTTASGGVVYKDAQSVKNLSSTKGATITLYAVWELAANAQFGQDGEWKPVILYIGKDGEWKNIVLSFGQDTWKNTGL